MLHLECRRSICCTAAFFGNCWGAGSLVYRPWCIVAIHSYLTRICTGKGKVKVASPHTGLPKLGVEFVEVVSSRLPEGSIDEIAYFSVLHFSERCHAGMVLPNEFSSVQRSCCAQAEFNDSIKTTISDPKPIRKSIIHMGESTSTFPLHSFAHVVL